MHRNGLVTVRNQRDFADQRVDPGDLAQNAEFIQHGRTGLDGGQCAFINDHFAGKGVGSVIQHLRGQSGRVETRAQVQKLAKARIFEAELFNLL